MSDSTIPDPVDGRFIFPVGQSMHIRFNADGWVEEIGRNGPDDPLGTKIQGKSGTGRDDIYARRYYDLYARVVLFDIHPKVSTSPSGTEGLLRFKDLEPGSHLYDRVNMIIRIGNKHFNLDVKELA